MVDGDCTALNVDVTEAICVVLGDAASIAALDGACALVGADSNLKARVVVV